MRLAAPPAHIEQCFEKLTDIPVARVEAAAAQAATDPAAARRLNAMAREFIVKLRRSEKAKSRCGKQMLAFYDRVKGNVDGGLKKRRRK
jgi:hypothetical protein